MRIISWNVNGIRSCTKKGFVDVIAQSGADIVGLQEVRALEEQIPEEVLALEGYQGNFFAAERKGYSGVGLLSTRAPDDVQTSLDEERFDCEGRFQLAKFGDLYISNIYFPNGNGKNRDNSRIPYKLDFYAAVKKKIDALKDAGEAVLVMGDYNTAHKPIDLARPKPNEKTSGFRPEERAVLDAWVTSGWVDTFREFETGPEKYSWWSQRSGARARNVGWRIDYVMASPAAMKRISNAFIWSDRMGSDHCPVGVDIDS